MRKDRNRGDVMEYMTDETVLSGNGVSGEYASRFGKRT